MGQRWGIRIDADGRIAGVVRLDGSASESTFDVVADKFRVYNGAQVEVELTEAQVRALADTALARDITALADTIHDNDRLTELRIRQAAGSLSPRETAELCDLEFARAKMEPRQTFVSATRDYLRALGRVARRRTSKLARSSVRLREVYLCDWFTGRDPRPAPKPALSDEAADALAAHTIRAMDQAVEWIRALREARPDRFDKDQR